MKATTCTVEAPSVQLGGALPPLMESVEADAHDTLARERLETFLRALVFDAKPASSERSTAPGLWMSRRAQRSGADPS